MLMAPPSVDFVSLAFALFRIGATVILIDPGMGLANLRRSVASVRPQALVGVQRALLFSRVCASDFGSVTLRVRVGPGLLGRSLTRLCQGMRPEDCPEPATSADDTAALIFTTGSTGPPKRYAIPTASFMPSSV